MKLSNKTYEYELNDQAIDECSAIIQEFLRSIKLPSKEVARYYLTAEDILLDLMDGESETPKHVKISTGRKLFVPYFSIEVDGVGKNVFIKGEEDHSFIGDSILRNLSLSPDYSYVNGKNEYSFRIKKKVNPFVPLLIAFGSAIIIGLIGLAIPSNIKDTISSLIIVPFYEAFLSILSCIAGPMIFLSVAWGIYGVGDVATLKKIGKTILIGFIGFLNIFVILIAGVTIPLFDFNYVSSGGVGNELQAIIDMIMAIVPNNIVSPFSDVNTLQIIFIAFIIGIALIALGKKTNMVALVIEQVNYIINFLTELIAKLVPFFIFFVLLKMIWSSSIDSLLSVWKLFAIFIGSVIVVTLLFTAYTAIKNKTNWFNLIKKGFPVLLTAITTASSSAAFSVNVKSSNEEYGVDKSIVSFGVPLGMVFFKVNTALSYLILTYFFAEQYAVEVSAAWFILVAFTVCVLSMATPPIPGGAAISYTILFAQFGIPVEALALTLTCDVFLDFICTGFDQFFIPFALVNRTKKLNLLDMDILKKHKEIKIKKKKVTN